MVTSDEEAVNATPHLVAWNQLAVENERAAAYGEAADFWRTYGELLAARREIYQTHRDHLLASSQWLTPAANAFYERVDMGLRSIDNWLNANLPDIATKFREAADLIGPKFQLVNENQGVLSGNVPVRNRTPTGLRPGVARPEFRMEGDFVFARSGSRAEEALDLIRGSELAAKEVAAKFDELKTAMRRLQVANLQDQEWAGPVPATAPSANPMSTGPGGPGGPSGGPTSPSPGPGGPGTAPGGGPEAPTAPESMSDTAPGGPGADQPGADQPGADAPGADVPGADVPGADQPGADLPGSPASTVGPAAVDDVGTSPLPPSDPALAGMPNATLTAPTSTTTPTSASSLPGSMPSTSTGGGPTSTMSSIPFTPTGSPTGLAPRGAQPPLSGPRGSTVDGARGGLPGAPGGQVPGPGQSTVPRGGPAGTTAGPGFYPPIMPPMGGGYGGAGSGIRPGEAEFAGGPIRRNSGPDSWRAGLRPQLLGRAGDQDDEPHEAPPPSAGDVLDEELWEVPGAAPATPPQPRRRHGGSWG